jgi:hypothetical protein
LVFNEISFLDGCSSELEAALTGFSCTDLELAFHKFELFSYGSKDAIHFVWGVLIVGGIAQIPEDAN